MSTHAPRESTSRSLRLFLERAGEGENRVPPLQCARLPSAPAGRRGERRRQQQALLGPLGVRADVVVARVTSSQRIRRCKHLVRAHGLLVSRCPCGRSFGDAFMMWAERSLLESFLKGMHWAEYLVVACSCHGLSRHPGPCLSRALPLEVESLEAVSLRAASLRAMSLRPAVHGRLGVGPRRRAFPIVPFCPALPSPQRGGLVEERL